MGCNHSLDTKMVDDSKLREAIDALREWQTTLGFSLHSLKMDVDELQLTVKQIGKRVSTLEGNNQESPE